MKVVREILETIWFFATVLSLITEPVEKLPWWGYIVWFGVLIGNLVVSYRYFEKRGLPRWLRQPVEKYKLSKNK